MPITIPLDRVEDRLRGGALWTTGWGTPEDPEDMTCLHGAIRYCQLVPGDAYLIEQVGNRHGFGLTDNDTSPSWEDLRPKVPAVVTDDMLADTFGPQWPQVVALVRRAAVLSAKEVKQLAAARDAAWSAPDWVAAGVALTPTGAPVGAVAEQQLAASDAVWAAAWGTAWGAAVAEQLFTVWADAPAAAWADAARAAARALTIRHLIGVHGFTQAHYDTRTGPWRTVIGPAHPDDVQAGTSHSLDDKQGVDWDSPTWGQPGHNVHESSVGSWLPEKTTDEE